MGAINPIKSMLHRLFYPNLPQFWGKIKIRVKMKQRHEAHKCLQNCLNNTLPMF